MMKRKKPVSIIYDENREGEHSIEMWKERGQALQANMEERKGEGGGAK
jgi:hypothetical protein